jgi:hypothetical protein
MLELDEGKLSRPVLRRGGESNLASLSRRVQPQLMARASRKVYQLKGRQNRFSRRQASRLTSLQKFQTELTAQVIRVKCFPDVASLILYLNVSMLLGMMLLLCFNVLAYRLSRDMASRSHIVRWCPETIRPRALTQLWKGQS